METRTFLIIWKAFDYKYLKCKVHSPSFKYEQYDWRLFCKHVAISVVDSSHYWHLRLLQIWWICYTDITSLEEQVGRPCIADVGFCLALFVKMLRNCSQSRLASTCACNEIDSGVIIVCDIQLAHLFHQGSTICVVICHFLVWVTKK